MKRFHSRKVEQPERPIRVDLPLHDVSPEKGLTSAQARELLEGGWGNEPVESPTKSDKQIIKENTFTYFNLIFAVLGICLILVGDFSDLLFELLVIANTVIGIVQQIRSKRTIEKLSVLSASRIPAIRDGTSVPLRTRELVRGDIVELSAGCQVPADGAVVTGQIQVNEGLITGEADAITKNSGDELLSGSFVISGKCRMRLVRVGADSYAAKLTLAAKKGHAPAKSEMMRSLDRLIRVIGIVLIPIGIALFYNQYVVQELGMRQSVISMVAALIGMIPEGLFLLTSVALAVSVIRLAQNRTLIHDMNAIETLARVDVLCVDKTGTVTSPEMELQEVVPLDADGENGIGEILGAFYRAMDADNDTARAIQKAYPNGPAWDAFSTVPFTSATKWSAVNFARQGSYVLGAPESILGSEFAPLEKRTRLYAEKGCRVLLLAQCDRAEEGLLSGILIPLALLVLENPIRKNAPKTFEYFHSQGVAVKVISGDNPVTVSAVAAQAGIDGAGDWVDARDLKTDQEIARAVRRYTVFGRVVPNQKRKIVRALQNAGHTVAMTGDGVNDVLALKDADCGIAMASGADAAAQVAQLVLLDSDFSAMTKVVAEGRRVINNIQRASALYLVKNILSFFLAIITLFADFPYPFVPVQLTLISALTIGIPSFFLALEPNHDLVRGKFLHNVFRRAFPGGLTAIIVILFAELFVYTFGLTLSELSTICVILMAINGFVVICYAARPLNTPRLVLLVSIPVAMLIAVSTMGDFFSLSGLSAAAVLVMIVLILLVVPIQMGFEKLFERACAFLDARRRPKRREVRESFRNEQEEKRR
ncbi:MAG: cation-translocating P-type ATPase [Oscillibacter sp.]|jgi:cation-transporting ATPase E|nr:cation-translocating P-type ATPase [Oscillibacter sp.]